jgi:alkyl hydroperoxide reductase subunit F
MASMNIGPQGFEVILPGAAGPQIHEDKLYDIAIVGGGPAGLTAAVYAARKKLEVIVISEDIGGQTLLTSDIENYMGFPLITGKELATKFGEHVRKYDVDLATGTKVTELKREDDRFLLTTTSGAVVKAKAVIIATGKRSRPLNVPGEKELVGHGVSYCAVCDAPLFPDKDVVVIGAGNSGATAVLDLIKIARKIYVVDVLPDWRADPVLIDRILAAGDKIKTYFGHEVVEIRGEGRVSGIVLRDRSSGNPVELEVQGVFIEIGLIPNSELVAELVELNQWGEIKVDNRCRTNVPGLFAAGDVTDVPEKQIIIAAGEGAKAALAAYDYLLRLKEVK